MKFEGLSIDRIIVHEVFRRDEDKNPKTPRMMSELITLDARGMDAMQNRMTENLGRATHSIEMEVAQTGPESLFQIARVLLDADDTLFVETSKLVAGALADAQTSRNIPGGILVVITGTVGVPKCRFIGFIKAEQHDGFVKEATLDGRWGLKFLDEVILTPQTRFYKIGALVEKDVKAAQSGLPTTGFSAFVFDEGITSSKKNGAAQYFVETFLGCRYPESPAKRTREFFDLTREFIRNLDIPEDKKTGMVGAIYTYLKVDTAPVVEVGVFSDRYISDEAMKKAYTAHMECHGFPMTAVPKDTAYLRSDLRTRKIEFQDDVKLTAPVEKFDQMVSIEPIDGDTDAHGMTPQWTRITIKGSIQRQ